MPVITLTTDLGDKDHYASALKAVILTQSPKSIIVDISHKIAAFNIMEAAFVLRSVFEKFPKGSIHLVSVDPEGGSNQRGIAMKFREHYFVGPDNGVLSLIKEREEAEVVRIEHEELNLIHKGKSFVGQNAYAPTAAWLAEGGKFSKIGEAHGMREFYWGEPSYTSNSLRGVILYVDHFGNALTNIRKDEFLRIKGSRSFQIFVRNLRIQRIVSTYSDVSRGEALALFGDNGHLEIAIREGSAEQLLGLNAQDMLTIEFYE